MTVLLERAEMQMQIHCRVDQSLEVKMVTVSGTEYSLLATSMDLSPAAIRSDASQLVAAIYCGGIVTAAPTKHSIPLRVQSPLCLVDWYLSYDSLTHSLHL